MLVIGGDNFTQLYGEITRQIMTTGERVSPRGLATREILGVATEILQPRQRVLWTAGRRPNPFFQWLETVWILYGSRDVDWIAFFNKEMRNFVDPDGLAWGVYGYRMRAAGGRDQLMTVLRRLFNDIDTRQAVISLWHPNMDQEEGHKDYPCNTTVYFKVRDGKLHVTVCNRSNDLHLGLAFTNITQFTTLMEVVAASLGLELGTYRHYSDSLHIYESSPHTQAVLENDEKTVDLYTYLQPTPMQARPFSELDTDIAALYLLHNGLAVCQTVGEADAVLGKAMTVIDDPYWISAACAMAAYHAMDVGRWLEFGPMDALTLMPACPDWFVSCVDFTLRRYRKMFRETGLTEDKMASDIVDRGLAWLAKHGVTNPAAALALWEERIK